MRSVPKAFTLPFTGAGQMSPQALLVRHSVEMAESPAVAKASNLVVLAALAKTRIAALPDITTMAELGFPAEGGFHAGGIIVPAKTRKPWWPDREGLRAAVATDGYKNAAEKLNAVAALSW